jgi:hypothetical protein
MLQQKLEEIKPALEKKLEWYKEQRATQWATLLFEMEYAVKNAYRLTKERRTKQERRIKRIAKIDRRVKQLTKLLKDKNECIQLLSTGQ